MRYGFTGSQNGTDSTLILSTLNTLNLTENDMIVTGACIGIDSQVSHIAKKHFPFVKQQIFVPNDKKKVDKSVYSNGNVIFMPKHTDYRYRNERIVFNSDILIAFWTGKKAYSGTYMTINIAKDNKIPVKIINI